MRCRCTPLEEEDKKKDEGSQSWHLIYSIVDISLFCLSYVMIIAHTFIVFSFVIFFGEYLGKE
jgi:hypothetical protein